MAGVLTIAVFEERTRLDAPSSNLVWCAVGEPELYHAVADPLGDRWWIVRRDF